MSEELKIAQQLGEQVNKECCKYSGSYINGVETNQRDKILPLYCPRCQEFEVFEENIQPLSSFGDNREILFCPHCDLIVELKVRL